MSQYNLPILAEKVIFFPMKNKEEEGRGEKLGGVEGRTPAPPSAYEQPHDDPAAVDQNIAEGAMPVGDPGLRQFRQSRMQYQEGRDSPTPTLP